MAQFGYAVVGEEAGVVGTGMAGIGGKNFPTEDLVPGWFHERHGRGLTNAFQRTAVRFVARCRAVIRVFLSAPSSAAQIVCGIAHGPTNIRNTQNQRRPRELPGPQHRAESTFGRYFRPSSILVTHALWRWRSVLSNTSTFSASALLNRRRSGSTCSQTPHRLCRRL